MLNKHAHKFTVKLLISLNAENNRGAESNLGGDGGNSDSKFALAFEISPIFAPSTSNFKTMVGKFESHKMVRYSVAPSDFLLNLEVSLEVDAVQPTLCKSFREIRRLDCNPGK